MFYVAGKMKQKSYAIVEPIIAVLCIMVLMTIQTVYQTKMHGLQSLGVIIVIIIAGYSYFSGKKYQKQRSWSVKLQALILGACIMAVAVGINAVITGLPIIDHLYKTLPLNLIIYNCFLAPIAEESIYRQLLYGNWRLMNGKWIGRIITGMIFVLMHYPQTPSSWLYYILSTIALYVAYELSGNDIRISILLHLINNLTVII